MIFLSEHALKPLQFLQSHTTSNLLASYTSELYGVGHVMYESHVATYKIQTECTTAKRALVLPLNRFCLRTMQGTTQEQIVWQGGKKKHSLHKLQIHMQAHAGTVAVVNLP